MAEFKNDVIGVSFSLPDAVTVRQQLAWRGRIFTHADEDAYTRNWLAILPLIEDWESEHIPDPAAFDLDVETSVDAATIVQYVANAGAGHMFGLDDVPKD